MNMGTKKRYIIVLAGFLLLALAVGVCLAQYRIPVISGVWKDLNSEYYIAFFDDGTYTETTYNLARPYAVNDGVLELYGVNGQVSKAELGRTFGGRLTVIVNGVERVMTRTGDDPTLFKWGTEVSGQPIVAYKLLANYDKDYYLRLYEDNKFISMLGKEQVTGKYALTDEGGLLIYTQGGVLYEYFQPWAGGFALGEMSTQLEDVTVKENAVDDRGILIRGNAHDPTTGVTYEFQDNNTVKRTDSNGVTAEFIYFADTDGLVSMTDTLGLRVEDYLYYDALTNKAYRYVFQRDGWTDFLNDAGSVGGDNSGD